MIDYYEYETSPRKLEPEYMPEIEKEVEEKTKTKKRTNTSTKAKRLKEKRKNIKTILEIGIGFIVLLTISYRYSLVNASFNEKESLKKQLSEINKQNEQLEVSIEQGMNINLIEQEAKEKLGMRKLDNNQKVYVSLDKEDYTESSVNDNVNEETESWWSKLLKDLFNIN